MENVNVTVTPTQTIVAAEAWDFQVNLTFLNPIEVCLYPSFYFKHRHMRLPKPRDWVKQSIPFSYIAFTAKSLKGNARHLQVYTDVSGGTRSLSSTTSCLSSLISEWSSGDRNQVIKWSATSNSDVVYHSVKLQTPAPFNEVSNQAEWGNLYYATQTVSNSCSSGPFSLLIVYGSGKYHLQDRSG